MTDIPLKKLTQGRARSSKHVESLLKSSQILYDARQYEQSFALSILAREELAKLLIIQNHLKANTIISYEEWKELTKGTRESTAHKIRLTFTQKEARENVQKLTPKQYEETQIQRERLGAGRSSVGYEEAMSLNTDYDKIYEKFDQLKQECFYLGWNGNFFTLSTRLDPNELQGLAYTHLMVIKQNYYTTFSTHIHNIITPEIELTLKSDPHFNEYLRIKQEMESDHSNKLKKLAWQAIDKLTKQ